MKSRNPYVITGITGKIGGILARTLLAANQPVRAVVRDTDKGAVWVAQGCELALAEMHDEAALTAAFEGAEAAFVLLPPNFVDKTAEKAGTVIGIIGASRAGKAPKVPPDRV